MKKNLLLLLAIFFFIGCATPVYLFPPDNQVRSMEWNIELISDSSLFLKVFKINDKFYAVAATETSVSGKKINLLDLEQAVIMTTEEAKAFREMAEKVVGLANQTISAVERGQIVDFKLFANQEVATTSVRRFSSGEFSSSSIETYYGMPLLLMLQYQKVKGRDDILLYLHSSQVSTDVEDLQELIKVLP